LPHLDYRQQGCIQQATEACSRLRASFPYVARSTQNHFGGRGNVCLTALKSPRRENLAPVPHAVSRGRISRRLR
jgi:hypothetical protein